MTPTKPTITEIITASETACNSLPEEEVSDLRARVAGIIRNRKPLKSNIWKEERRAIQDLRKEKSIKILLADKGKYTVVMDTTSYKAKCQALLDDPKTYEKIKKDPTQKYKK